MPTRFGVEIVGLKSYAKRQGLSATHEPNAEVVPISAAIELMATAGPDLGVMSRSDAVSDGDAWPARSGRPQPDS